jgi:hypothetical protein
MSRSRSPVTAWTWMNTTMTKLKRYRLELPRHEGVPGVDLKVEDPSGPYYLVSDVEATRGLRTLDLWKDKIQLGVDIEAVLKPFLDKYQLHGDQVRVDVHYSGVMVKVTL